jgi:hypothetical protein
MIELGPAGFLKTILYIVAFYYVGKFLFKWWLKRKITSHAQKMNSSVNQTEADYMRKAEGHVSIKEERKKNPNSGSENSGDSADYVDFEEVD